jgi:hypothetical protein
MTRAFILLPLLALAACGSSDPASNTAERLQEAAEQSDPAAAEVLENAAAQIDDQNAAAPAGAPGSAAQEALEAAGNAQAATVQTGGGNTATPGPPPGAKPHAPGDPVPPPKVTPDDR